MILRRAMAVFTLLAASCFAADVDGKWTGTFTTPNGDIPVNFTFLANGAALTGTTAGPQGEVKIADGKVDGNNISFVITYDFGGMPLTINYKGAVAKDQIKMTLDIMGMPVDLLLKKAS
jgi:hypothetical protein